MALENIELLLDLMPQSFLIIRKLHLRIRWRIIKFYYSIVKRLQFHTNRAISGEGKTTKCRSHLKSITWLLFSNHNLSVGCQLYPFLTGRVFNISKCNTATTTFLSSPKCKVLGGVLYVIFIWMLNIRSRSESADTVLSKRTYSQQTVTLINTMTGTIVHQRLYRRTFSNRITRSSDSGSW